MDLQCFRSCLARGFGAIRWAALIAFLALFMPLARAGDTAPIRLQNDPNEILAAVARRMNVTLRPDRPLPRIYFESSTSLEQFQDAIAPQWHFRPPLFANAYVVARNEIYLMDDPSYYRRMRRTLDESLAHEFAHYLQVMYFAADLADETCEGEAIAVQIAFRDAQEQAPGETS
jgi:hypothetical protein